MKTPIRKIYIAFKEKQTYPATGNVTWNQKLVGPFSDGEATDVWANLRDVKLDVKDIKVLKDLY